MTYFAAPGTKSKIILQPKLLSLRQQKELARSICNAVCSYYDVDFEDLFRIGRKERIVIARQISIYLIRMYSGMTLTETGRFFNKDHTTIIYSFQKIQSQLNNKFDDSYKVDIEKIKMML